MSMPAERLQNSRSLQDLLAGLGEAPAVEITGIGTDSRRLEAGDLFVACAGDASHGMDYLAEALESNVAAVIYDLDTAQAPAQNFGTPVVGIGGLANQVGEIANRWFDRPSAAIDVTGVTGTNGKTTVALILAQSLHHLGVECGYIGTLGYGVHELDESAALTTPACVDMHRRLADIRDQGARAAAIEVSSHALMQNRVDGVRFESALFTNLSRDHIDYHGDMESYFEAKARLFTDANPAGAVICIDTDAGVDLADRCADAVIVSTDAGLTANGRPFLFVRSLHADATGASVEFDSAWGSGTMRLNLVGQFNVANASVVLADLLRRGFELDAACDALSNTRAPAGRMQRVECDGLELPVVVVDYSHTPDSLSVALRALRRHCDGNLWCVFGCGGDRDVGKRPLMGSVASQKADRIVVTNDNPRSEDPAAIIASIVDGIDGNATIIEDRGAAIAYAIEHAAPTDTILIAGKGHEDYQLLGAERIRFSDFAAALGNLEARAAK